MAYSRPKRSSKTRNKSGLGARSSSTPTIGMRTLPMSLTRGLSIASRSCQLIGSTRFSRIRSTYQALRRRVLQTSGRVRIFPSWPKNSGSLRRLFTSGVSDLPLTVSGRSSRTLKIRQLTGSRLKCGTGRLGSAFASKLTSHKRSSMRWRSHMRLARKSTRMRCLN